MTGFPLSEISPIARTIQRFWMGYENEGVVRIAMYPTD
jgi:hypothetical protein